MNKTGTVLVVGLILVSFAFAGGIMTNTNQSAAWVRTLHRDATTDIDAVYYNPAGLTKLQDGFHFSFSNQYITQTKEVVNNYTYLNESKYVGDVAAPFFPGVYMAYKTGNLAFSAGLNPIGGGGGAEYKTGLPSFEMPMSDLVPGLVAEGQNVTDYDVDVYFEGTSVYLGGQFGVSYKVNDMISVAVGGRFVSAKDTKKGHLKDGKILLDGSWTSASTFFTGAANDFNSLAGTDESLQPIIDSGGGSLTLGEAQDMGFLDSIQVVGISAGFAYIDPNIDPSVLNIEEIQGYYYAASDEFLSTAAEMTAKATLTGDQEADVIQTGSGFTPIISLNISPMEGLNIGFRYEHLTSLELENDTKKDITTGFEADGTPITEFPDGAKSHSDMPSMIALGVSYQVMPQLRAETSLHYYMDKDADYSGKEAYIDDNYYETGIALEYALNDKIKLSGGYLLAKTGVSEDYQSDLSYSLSSNTIGFGGAYSISPKMDLNFGVSFTTYDEADRSDQHDLGGSGLLVPFTETYNKESTVIAIGVDYKL